MPDLTTQTDFPLSLPRHIPSPLLPCIQQEVASGEVPQFTRQKGGGPAFPWISWSSRWILHAVFLHNWVCRGARLPWLRGNIKSPPGEFGTQCLGFEGFTQLK